MFMIFFFTSLRASLYQHHLGPGTKKPTHSTLTKIGTVFNRVPTQIITDSIYLAALFLPTNSNPFYSFFCSFRLIRLIAEHIN